MKDGSVELAAEFACRRVQAAHNFGNVAPGNRVITRVLSLRREGDEERILATLIAARGFQSLGVFLENGDKHLFRRARICRALKDNQLPSADVRGNGLGGGDDIAEVGLVMVVEWCGHAD